MSIDYQTIHRVMELLYFASGVALAVIAAIGLRQLSLAKRDIETRVSREAAKAASDQLEHWASVIIPKANEYFNELTARNISMVRRSMEHFDLDEAVALGGDTLAHHNKMADVLNKNVGVKDLLLASMNLIEASAMSFMTGVADEKVAFQPLGLAFCELVERTYYAYCGMRERGSLNRWEYTVRLHRVWSHRLKKYDLDKLQASLSEDLRKATKESAPVKVLGASA